MTSCAVYVGDLNDPAFDWEGGSWESNIPARMSMDFPSEREHYNGIYRRWVEEKFIDCKQTDFGGWVARVTKAQIEDYLAYCYDSDPSYTEKRRMLEWRGKYYQVEKLIEIRAFLKGFDNQKLYALVATEF